jgi:tetratricopeptide (TPR) repeat protein
VDAARHFRAAASDSAVTMAPILAAWCEYAERRASVADSIALAVRQRPLRPLDQALLDYEAARFQRDLPRAYRASQTLSAVAPNSEWRLMQAQVALDLGRAAESVRLLEQISPDLGWLRNYFVYWGMLGRGLHFLGEHTRELAAAEAGRRRFPVNRILTQGHLKALAALGRIATIDSVLDYVLTLRQHGGWGDSQPMDQTIFELRAHGHGVAAQRLARRSLDWLRLQPKEIQDNLAPVVPGWLYAMGDLAGARQAVEQIVAANPQDIDNLVLLAVIGAEQGDLALARAIDLKLRNIHDPDGLDDLLISRAQIAAAMNDREAAVTMIRDALRLGFAWRNVLHILPGFDQLRGYQPLETLLRETP